MRMKLQINRGEGWRTLRTSEGEGLTSDYIYLKGLMNDWHQNYYDFAGAKYRIGRYVSSYGSGDEPFEIYDPVTKGFIPEVAHE